MVQNIGKYRDAFLVLVGIVYFAGYTVISLSAFHNNLGPMTIFDSQYLVAGLPICLLALFLLIVVKYYYRFLINIWPNWVVRRKRPIRVLIMVILATLIAVWFHYMPHMRQPPFRTPSMEDILYYGAGCVLTTLFINGAFRYTYTVFRPKNRIVRNLHDFMENKFFAFYRIIYNPLTYILIILGIILLASMYMNSIYPKIPQEFGGMKPRVAILDVVSGDLSNEMTKDLGIRQDLQGIVGQTDTINVYYIGNDNLIIGIRATATAKSGCRYEISRSAIKSIEWLK